jgi:hypothetical protein
MIKMATDIQLKQWRSELKRDYPQIEDYFLNLVIDLYKANPDYVKKLSKKKFKEASNDIPHEIVGAVNIIPADDKETMDKYFKEAIVLPKEDDEASA